MSISEYRLVTGSRTDVTEEVNFLLREGWRVCGGVCLGIAVAADREGVMSSEKWAQAMIKEVTKDDSGD